MAVIATLGHKLRKIQKKSPSSPLKTVHPIPEPAPTGHKPLTPILSVLLHWHHPQCTRTCGIGNLGLREVNPGEHIGQVCGAELL